MYDPSSKRRVKVTLCCISAVVLISLSSIAQAATVISIPFDGSSGDHIDRGFYLSNYPASHLGTVTLAYSASVAGTYTTSLEARLGAYDGPLVGTVSLTTSLPLVHDPNAPVTYDFGNVAVPIGSTIAFLQTLISGPSSTVYYDVGGHSTTALVTETEGTTPPLDVFRRSQVGIIVTASDLSVPEPLPVACVGLGLALLYRLRRSA